MKVIKEGFEKLGLLKINDDSFACNTPLGTIFNEFSRLSEMDDDLFTYKVEIPGLPTIPFDKKEGDDSDDGDLDIYEPRVCYDENERIYAKAVIFVNKRLVRLMDVTVEQWLDLIYGNHMKVDGKIQEGVISKWLVQNYKKQFDEHMEIKKQWVTHGINADMEYNPSDIYWIRGDDEVELTDEEFYDPDDGNLINKDEVATYDEFKNEWMDEWTKGIPRVPKEPWSKNGIPIDDIHHICEPIYFRNGKAKWPTSNSNDDGFCNGGELPGMVRVGYMTYFQDYEWAYANTNIDANYNPYLDVSRTFNNHEGSNNEKDILEEKEPNNDHGIDNLDYDLV
ncbi:hypothetical protein Tco_0960265 [Tanacetum coccineum]